MSSSDELHHVDNDEVDHPNGCNNISLLLGEELERDSQLQEQLTSSSQQLRKEIWDGSTITLELTDSPPDSPSPSDSPSASPPQLPLTLLSQVQCGVCLDYFSDSLVVAPCGHCKSCLQDWLQNSQECPKCRRKMKKKDKDEDRDEDKEKTYKCI